MRKNRKRTRMMSVTAVRSMRIGAVIMSLFVMVIVNMLANSHCDQMMKAICIKEKELTKLGKDVERESAKWENMTTPDKLDKILMHLGMPMKYPRPEQIVYMSADGRPERGQISVARAERRRARESAVVSNDVKPRAKQLRKRR